MVIRYLCRCITCGHPHTLRIAMGHSHIQKHTFRCGGCGEEMLIEVTQKPEIGSAIINCASNCEESTEEGLIINLHPDFPIKEDQLHVDGVFPWLEHVQNIATRQMELGATMPQFSSIEEYKRYILDIQTPLERWAIVKKGWSLARNGRHDLSRAVFEKYNFGGAESSSELHDVLFHFCGTLLNRGQFPLFTHAAELLAECCKRFPQEFDRLKNIHCSQWLSDHLDGYLNIFSEYFRDFGEYSQTLLMYQYGLPIEESAIASSSAFSRTKMFYGNAFEVLTSHFVVFACLNNVLSGRPFDHVKENRDNSFTETEPFAVFASKLDSTLRNASHHGSIKLDQAHKLIAFRSGGTGAEHKMRYSEYLALCNDHMLKLAALLMLELILAQ
jgi:hypothetical protein